MTSQDKACGISLIFTRHIKGLQSLLFRGVFKTQSKIEDGAFYENS